MSAGVSSSPTRQWRHRDSPRVRRLAREAGIDLARLQPTGRHGRATAADLAAAQEDEPTSSSPSGSPVSPPAASRPSPVRLTSAVEVDLTDVVKACAAAGAEISPLAFVAEAAVNALARHHDLVSSGGDEASAASPAAVHLGVVSYTGEGSTVSLLRDAQDLTIAGLARRIAGETRTAAAGSEGADLSGVTLAVTSAAELGALFDTPALPGVNAPVLGLGAVVRRPVVVVDAAGEERIALRSMAYLVLAYDHRRGDGGEAARYLATVKNRLQRWDEAAPEAVPQGA